MIPDTGRACCVAQLSQSQLTKTLKNCHTVNEALGSWATTWGLCNRLTAANSFGRLTLQHKYTAVQFQRSRLNFYRLWVLVCKCSGPNLLALHDARAAHASRRARSGIKRAAVPACTRFRAACDVCHDIISHFLNETM